MSEPSPAAIEQSLLRYGDDLYRLALLLAPDERRAGALVAVAVRRACQAPMPPDEPALLAALVAALPPAGSRQERPPAGLARAALRPADAPVLAALARLPRRQRLALGLLLLRDHDAEQAAAASGTDAEQLRQQLRDALAALAPQVAPDLPPAHFAETDVPEECLPTRRALALGSPLLHTHPAIRGHLALCQECRAVERSWEQLSARVEETLRYTLREVALPGELVEQALAAPRARWLARLRAALGRPGLRLALVPLAVLVLIAALVLPRARPAASPTGATPATALAPQALAALALERLYTPPADGGRGVWHGRWRMRWDFDTTVYANLNGDLWLDPARGRHRVQLVHEAGGGPYEFELADGQQRLIYAATRLYADSLAPGMAPDRLAPLNFQATPEQQGRALTARLDSGAWSSAGRYLRQALAAPDLKSWGRQRDADGATLEVLGFRGYSPLGMPPDTPGAPSQPATLLLSIDTASATLREVRELSGPPGSEQIGRTTWRFLGGEWVADPAAADRALDPARAWSGTSPLSSRSQPLASPDFPLLPAGAVEPLARTLVESWGWPPLPASPPPGARAAVLRAPPDTGSAERLAAYTGEGRLLVLSQVWSATAGSPPAAPGELLSQDDLQITLLPGSGMRYQALVRQTGRSDGQTLVRQSARLDGQTLRINAQGYTRAELLALIRQLRPLSPAAFRAQQALFADPRPGDPQARALLLDLLDQAAEARPGQIHHTVERVFSRRQGFVARQPSPYQAPLFGGIPEQTRAEQWVRQGQDGRVVVGQTSSITDTDLGFERRYQSAEQSWSHQPLLDQLRILDSDGREPHSQLAQRLLELLACGGVALERAADGSALISQVQADWRTRSCGAGSYTEQLAQQQREGYWESQPYLTDLVESEPISLWLYLSPAGRAVRLEARAGQTRASMLVEAREILTDEWLPAAQVDPALFDPRPPQALVTARGSFQVLAPDQPDPQPAREQTLTLSQAAAAQPTPLWVLPAQAAPPAPTAELREIVRVSGFAGPVNHESPALDAFLRGLALRLSYNIHTAGDGIMALEIYQGPAERLGRYLRTQARWRSSTPITHSVGGQTTTVWHMTALDDRPWLVFERDGTLVCIAADIPDQDALLRQLVNDTTIQR